MAQNPSMIFMYLLLRDEGSKAHSKGVEGSKAHSKGVEGSKAHSEGVKLAESGQ